jgi:hypothetical protein
MIKRIEFQVSQVQGKNYDQEGPENRRAPIARCKRLFDAMHALRARMTT